MQTISPPTQSTTIGQPTWEVAHLYPDQGDWSEEQYLRLTDSTNKLIEFTDGRIEMLPMPSIRHQRILSYLFKALDAYVSARGLGEVLLSGTRVRTTPGKYREPDVVFQATEHAIPNAWRYWDAVDLAMEVVSPDDPLRDRVQKRLDYAQAAIGEYWIVDPLEQRITVLTLDEDRYLEHGVYDLKQTAASALLPGFEVDVSQVFALGRDK